MVFKVKRNVSKNAFFEAFPLELCCATAGDIMSKSRKKKSKSR